MTARSNSEAAAPVSFGFSRKAERNRVLAAGPCAKIPEDDDDDDGGGGEGDTEFLTAVEGRELLGTRPPPSPRKELVIPLLPPTSHRWRDREPSSSSGSVLSSSSAPSSGSAPSVEEQAVQELLQEARQSQEQTDDPCRPSISIPLQLQDGPLQPEPGPQDYQAVPVEAFGLAMLRGMGWNRGEGIGRTFKQVVKPLEHQLRPRGLGLGAQPTPTVGQDPPKLGQDPLKLGQPTSKKRGADDDSRTGGLLAVGTAVRIEAGPHRGMVGKVEGLVPETARAMVRLALGGQTVTVSQHCLRAATLPGTGSASRNSKTPDPKEPPNPEEGARSKRNFPSKSPREVKKFREGPPEHPRPWIRRDLRVRCIDRSFQAGNFYNCKMVVEDMVTPDSCVCRTDEGRLVENLRESMLETVIPRGEADWVMVVQGEHRGKIGRILEREPGQSRALVQLERDGNARVVPLDYDAICHYVGGGEDD